MLAAKGKGQATKSTLVPLNSALVAAVARATVGRTSGLLMVTSNGRRLTRQHAAKLIRRLGEQVGLPRLHPHELRHAFVTLSLDEGEALRDVQDAACHADPRTPRRYDRNRSGLDRHPTHRLLVALEPWAASTRPSLAQRQAGERSGFQLPSSRRTAKALSGMPGIRKIAKPSPP